MKLKIFLAGLLFLLIAFSSCVDTDEVDYASKDVDTDVLSFTAYLTSDYKTSVKAELDLVNKKIEFEFPYYSSDTEPIITDVTNLILSANLPDGAVVTPRLQTIRDLTDPTNIKIDYVNGTTDIFEMSAKLVKSSKADILSVVMPGIPTAKTAIESADGVNKILIYRTSSEIYEELKSAEVEFVVSPWATSSIEKGTILDLTQDQQITVTAQDGTTKIYTTEVVYPEYVDAGEIGNISVLFGFQVSSTDTHGFEVNKNRTLAVVNKELIVSHDDGDFKRYNRFTGELLDKTVNTTGTISGVLHGITADSQGTLLATTYTLVTANQWVTNTTFEIYAWTNGLDNPPVKLLSKDISDQSLFSTGEIGRTISVYGDISQEANIMFVNKTDKKVVGYHVEGGVITNASSPFIGSFGVTLSNNGKAIPTSTVYPPAAYILSGVSGNTQYQLNPQVAISPGSTWWATDIKGSAYAEFNEVRMLATQNGLAGSDGADYYNRLVVGNITNLTSATGANVFNSDRIMDSRLENYDPNVSGTQNATITGMTNASTQLAANGNRTGDVCFSQNDDESAIQVYLMTTNHGMFAYEITKFK